VKVVVQDSKSGATTRRGSAVGTRRFSRATGAMSTLVGGLVAVNRVRTQSLASFGRDSGSKSGGKGSPIQVRIGLKNFEGLQ
jgi:hypothetical protein